MSHRGHRGHRGQGRTDIPVRRELWSVRLFAAVRLVLDARGWLATRDTRDTKRAMGMGVMGVEPQRAQRAG